MWAMRSQTSGGWSCDKNRNCGHRRAPSMTGSVELAAHEKHHMMREQEEDDDLEIK